MMTRILTAAVLILGIGAGIWLKGWVLRAILLACMLLSIDETQRALQKAGLRPVRWIGWIYAVVAMLAQAGRALLPGGFFAAVDPALLAVTIALLIAAAVIVLRGRIDFDGLVATAFPVIYPGLLFALLLPLQDLATPQVSTLALVLAFFIASVNDTFALFIGLKFGKHRLSPEISPKKSVEGSIAGLVASVIFAVLAPIVARAIHPEGLAGLPPLWAFAALGLVAGALSQIGDLLASLVKRHCGIKDFGNIFPGHGGMLDRFDGILFCGAACYFFFKGFDL